MKENDKRKGKNTRRGKCKNETGRTDLVYKVYGIRVDLKSVLVKKEEKKKIRRQKYFST